MMYNRVTIVANRGRLSISPLFTRSLSSSSSSPSPSTANVLMATTKHVTTITMNSPKSLNGWTDGMMKSLSGAFAKAAEDPECKVLVLTGMDPYYCAGVNLAGSIQLMHPKKLFDSIVKRNESLFNMFLDCPKPLIVAINGPVIGAACTSATLSDAIIASERATFLTPFGRLAVAPEGCSSVHFEYLMGAAYARRMLEENWQPTASEALEAGLITHVVPHDQLLTAAQSLAEEWIDSKRYLQPRTAMGYKDIEKLKAVNAVESVNVATSFLSEKFLRAQVAFLESKGKTQLALIFKSVLVARPLWSKLL